MKPELRTDEGDDGFVPPRSGSFRIIETRLPTAGVDFPRDLAELEQMFATERDCQAYLERLRWPRGYRCAECGSRAEPWRSGTGLLGCSECKALCAVTQGSLFHGAAIPLGRWFRAAWEATDGESGTSVAALQRVLRLHDAAASERCLDALRVAMALPTRAKLKGAVQVAKTMVEVSHRGAFGRTSTQRVQVALAVEHRGADSMQLRARHLRRVDSSEAIDFVRDNVEPGADVITAPWAGYSKLGAAGYHHATLPTTLPSSDGGAMPSVEQAAAVLRLWLWSTHDVTLDSLTGCLNEFVFRFNRRWYPRGLLFYRLMILAALFGTADDEMLGIAAAG